MSPREDALPTIGDLLGPGGAADRIVPGWEVRPAQLDMAEAVLARLSGGGQVVVEAPTGVGKTLGYLVPAVLSGKRVVVSTNTKTLQDQIIEKDLVALTDMFAEVGVELFRASADVDAPLEPHQVRYALMKGRSNYVCLSRLEERRRQRAFDFDTDLLSEIQEWAETTERGDRAELLGLSEGSGLWSEIDARSEICTGTRCARYEACFVTRMRAEAAASRVVIVNHHLLLADLALKARAKLATGRSFGAVIPPADALVLDEAHSLEETASEYFGGQVTTRKVERLGKDLATFAQTPSFGRDRTLLALRVTEAIAAAEAVFAALPAVEGRLRLDAGVDGPRRGPGLARAQASLPKLEAAFAALKEAMEPEVLEDAAAESLLRRAQEVAESLRFVLGRADPAFVYWVEKGARGGALGASPIDVSNLLREFLLEAFEAVTLTSATLAAGRRDLAYFKASVGLAEEAETLVLASPFDFARQAAIFLPEDAVDPTAPDAIEALARQGAATIRVVGGGALFLFTSYRVMNAVAKRLKGSLPYPVLVQGDMPKRALVERFVAAAPAVLCATASFWEGVDVPGDPLRLVLIDRLPFDSPGDPLVAARAENLTRAGRNAFAQLHLPRAVLRLKQGFGRLVRSRTDRGVVALLDRRVQTKGYGKAFLSALPDAPRLTTLGALEDWWAVTESGETPEVLGA